MKKEEMEVIIDKQCVYIDLLLSHLDQMGIYCTESMGDSEDGKNLLRIMGKLSVKLLELGEKH